MLTPYLVPPAQGVLIDMAELLDKFAAGDLIRKRREDLGLTQEQVVEATTVPVAAYLSELENGKVSVGRSKHFPSLAKFLKLSEEDVRAISPAAVFEIPAPRNGPPVSPRLPEAEVPLEIPSALQQMIDKHGDDYPELHIEANLRALTSFYRYGGATDLSPQEWFEVFTTNRRWLVKP